MAAHNHERRDSRLRLKRQDQGGPCTNITTYLIASAPSKRDSRARSRRPTSRRKFPGLGPRGDRPFAATLGAGSRSAYCPGQLPGRGPIIRSRRRQKMFQSAYHWHSRTWGCHDLHHPNSSAWASFQTRSRRRTSSELGPRADHPTAAALGAGVAVGQRHRDSGPEQTVRTRRLSGQCLWRPTSLGLGPEQSARTLRHSGQCIWSCGSRTRAPGRQTSGRHFPSRAVGGLFQSRVGGESRDPAPSGTAAMSTVGL